MSTTSGTIVVLTSCTGEKAVDSPRRLTGDDFLAGSDRVAERERELAALLRPAQSMYTGQQHIRLMRGVRRASLAGLPVQVHIVSAGYGLIAGERPIAPYNITFSNMSKSQAVTWGRQLRLPADVGEVLRGDQTLTLVALGEHYLDGCGLSGAINARGTVIFFGGDALSRRVHWNDQVRHVHLTREDTSRFSAGQIALKGEVIGRYLESLTRNDGRPVPLPDLASLAAMH